MTKIALTFLTISIIAAILFYSYARPIWVPAYQKVVGKQSVNDVIQRYGDKAEQNLKPYFDKAGVNYPPQEITLLAIKDESRLELWSNDSEKPTFIRDYPILAASGVLGPKLREGDRQVPEGIYQLEYLNPNSSYHLSVKINYPNAFDLKHAKSEGRDQPGSNIFIHGKAVSIGCLAMGDDVIEDLFVLIAKTGRSKVTVAITPSDPRLHILENTSDKAWVTQLYQELSDFFSDYQ